MKLARTCFLLLPLSLVACNATLPQIAETGAAVASATGYNNQAQLIRAIKETLELGSSRATASLSASGGYANSSLYRIGLPANLQPIASNLRQLGLGAQIDKVEALMNQGAEKAAGEAATVFIDAVRNMSVTDALGIIRGSDTAATDYFRAQTEASLRQRYQPIIQQNLEQIGFYSQYKQLLNTYNLLPIANKPSLDLEQHALNMALDGLFKQVAVEEKLIRKDPVQRGSQIIGAVFGQKQ
ncbi:DUF4197 domain-containing protein [Cellvibrio japonicus]|uniref:Putative lipoprotein n=1 Tax=Cellvibrio japonicus (strain Ueda107) TaxID=498211 RepID=B3PGH9_CELJU|nr:DUF4197 domain-containing protein [Cellvibrio japonicus]ACE83461.1 putative lipoprotein [Cellvibrio japonicus Ueda107]QEI10964.1 DUF4197 domain-containing protein [Cellvibrio japonicus]QEI14540.1 DUF4197 domain-containing protein [Cellvibrio japonicus]QEI18118.1 DUF4197 domain-containing protein [Cellvibrio japonicus]